MTEQTNPPSTPAVSRSRRRVLTVLGAILVPLSLVGLALAAIGDGEQALDRIPAAIVNNDEIVTIVDDNGDEQMILAGRQLVTELTGPDSVGFDWRPMGEDEAAVALADGDVYAVVTIPSDFSASLTSVSQAGAQPASLLVETDDSRSYLAGPVMQGVGTGLVAQFGSEITAQYVDGLAGGLDDLGSALGTAAEGATELADGTRELQGGVREITNGVSGLQSGASELGNGLGQAASGARQSADGAGELSGGVSGYTQGVDSLSDGLDQLNVGASSLGGLSTAVAGVSTGASSLLVEVQALLVTAQGAGSDPAVILAIQDLIANAQVHAATAAGTSSAVTPALSQITTGVGQSTAGAAALSSESAALRGGAADLAAGLDDLADGLVQSRNGAFELAGGAGQLAEGNAEVADGVGELASGTDELAAGLEEGADSVPGDVADVPDAATEPVTLESTRANQIDDIGGLIVAVLAPLGLWFGAMAVTLALPGRASALVGAPLGAGAALRRRLLTLAGVSVVQTILVGLLAHTVAGVAWSLAPSVFGLLLVTSLAFTAVHVALAQWIGRASIVVSLLALAIQAIVVGGVIPVEALADPFPALSGILPLSQASDGLLAIVAGGSADRAVSAVVSLVLLTLVSLIVARLAAGRARRRAVLRRFAPSMV